MPYAGFPAPSAFATKLAARPDAERMRLRVGTMLVEGRHKLWPVEAPSPDEIREHLDVMIAVLEETLGIDADAQPRRFVPARLAWAVRVFRAINDD